MFWSARKGKSGYLHWQIYLSHDQPIRFSTLKNKLPTAHLEPRRGTAREAVAYVTKEKRESKANCRWSKAKSTSRRVKVNALTWRSFAKKSCPLTASYLAC
ncbi:hypothetical protein [Corynebacterium sp. KPL2825]|uniref:hypothetical protein n=1 Tax=Corynebacterium sp. KPL2825 TaxID=3135444 RepID=UPI0040401B3D